MNPRICKTCKKCDKIYYLDPINECVCIWHDSVLSKSVLESLIESSTKLYKKSNNKKQLTINRISKEDSGFDLIVNVLNISNDSNCPFRTEHEVYDNIRNKK